jgi:hypothetical protein
MQRKRPCSICRRWFWPDPRVGDRQRVCSAPACQRARRKKTQAAWCDANPSYFAERRLIERAGRSKQQTMSNAQAKPTKTAQKRGNGTKKPTKKLPPRMPPPLDRLAWDVAQDEFGTQGCKFIEDLSRVLLKTRQDQRPAQVLDTSQEFGAHLGRVAQDQTDRASNVS